MTQRDTIVSELKELDSSLALNSLQNIYTVPAGYFEELAEAILSRVKQSGPAEELAELSPLLSSITKNTPYSVPTDYFETFEQPILSLQLENATEELMTMSPLLASIKKENPHTVPASYFDTVADNLLEKIKRKPGKLVSFTNSKWFRYAAAAVVIGFIASSVAVFYNKKETVNANTAPYAWIEKNLKKVSTDDIDQFVQLADAGSSSSDLVKKEAEEEVKKLMKDVSDKEIQDFLKDTSPDDQDNDDILLN